MNSLVSKRANKCQLNSVITLVFKSKAESIKSVISFLKVKRCQLNSRISFKKKREEMSVKFNF